LIAYSFIPKPAVRARFNIDRTAAILAGTAAFGTHRRRPLSNRHPQKGTRPMITRQEAIE
jgi:hypothetical protein